MDFRKALIEIAQLKKIVLQKLLLFRKRTSWGKVHSPGWCLQCVIAVVSDFRGEGLVYTGSCTQDKPPSLKASNLLSSFVSWRRPSCPVIAGVWGLLWFKKWHWAGSHLEATDCSLGSSFKNPDEKREQSLLGTEWVSAKRAPYLSLMTTSPQDWQ